jgi:tetratricopeptide (TPR) repeat protein
VILSTLSHRTTVVSENLSEITQQIEKQNEEIVKKQKSWMKIQDELKERRDKEELEHKQGKPETEQIVFSIFNRAGLSHKFPTLVASSDQISYWKTGIFLMNSFLVDKEKRQQYISASEKLVEINEMAPSSLGFNLYLLGKMESYLGNNEKAIKWFEKCKQIAPLMYEYLMTQDPTYDLESIRQYLISNSKKQK